MHAAGNFSRLLFLHLLVLTDLLVWPYLITWLNVYEVRVSNVQGRLSEGRIEDKRRKRTGANLKMERKSEVDNLLTQRDEC